MACFKADELFGEADTTIHSFVNKAKTCIINENEESPCYYPSIADWSNLFHRANTLRVKEEYKHIWKLAKKLSHTTPEIFGASFMVHVRGEPQTNCTVHIGN